MELPPERAISISELEAIGVTRGKSRAKLWDKPHRGVTRRVKETPDATMVRIEDAVPLLRDGCLLGGWASAHHQGVGYLDGKAGGNLLPVPIHTPHSRRLRHRRGTVVTRRRLHANEQIVFDGIAVSSLARALYDAALDARGFTDAVIALEMGLSTTTGHAHTTIENLRRVFDAHHKTRGIVGARAAFAFASTRSASPLESRTRVVAVQDAGVADWKVNCPIFDQAGNLLGVADLFNEEAGLVVEADGADHREEEAHSDDNEREERFERSKLIVVRVTGRNHRDRAGVARRIRLAYDEGIGWNRNREGWTLEKPDWWARWPPARRWD